MGRNSKTWQRARKPEQKAERRQAILDAAGSLLDEAGLDETALNEIARRSGIAKSNVYRYFESREAILLELLLAETDAWVKALRTRLKPLAGSGDIDAVAAAFAASLTRRRRFCILIGALASVLEHNVGETTLAEFKGRLLEALTPAAAALDEAVPALGPERAFSCLAMLIMAASGAWPHCHPAPAVKRVLKRPEFASMRLDFESTMRDYAALLVRGLSDERP